jgi:gluconate 2-dehydrogenase gamma chain
MAPHDAGAPAQPPRLQHFSAAQGVEVEALSARIIPSDDGPGAREAGVVYFIDLGMRTFAKDQAKDFDAGLVAVSKAVAKKHKGETRFSALTAAQQDEILRGMERTPFFGTLRFATIAGFLALPKYGGNKDYIGWKLVGQDHTFEHKPPFGWYDRPENQRALLGRVL